MFLLASFSGGVQTAIVVALLGYALTLLLGLATLLLYSFIMWAVQVVN